jgi:hypothetical protein
MNHRRSKGAISAIPSRRVDAMIHAVDRAHVHVYGELNGSRI